MPGASGPSRSSSRVIRAVEIVTRQLVRMGANDRRLATLSTQVAALSANTYKSYGACPTTRSAGPGLPALPPQSKVELRVTALRALSHAALPTSEEAL